MRLSSSSALAMLLLFGYATPRVSARTKHERPAQDRISVESHLVVTGGPIVRFVATTHYDHPYVYAERAKGEPVTLLDLTNPRHPVVLSQFSSPGLSDSLLAVAGTAALSGTADGQEAPASTQTVRLMDFSDPGHPTVTREFSSVSAVQKLSNGLILLANPEGVWVLSQHLADDPAVEAAYAHRVLYQ